MTKETFISTCKEAIKLQKQSGEGMSTMNINEILICPFCGTRMKTKKVQEKWIQYCECEKAIKINKKLNEVIDVQMQAIIEMQALHNEVLNSALKYYQSYYKDVIIDQLLKNIENERNEILSITSLN